MATIKPLAGRNFCEIECFKRCSTYFLPALFVTILLSTGLTRSPLLICLVLLLLFTRMVLRPSRLAILFARFARAVAVWWRRRHEVVGPSAFFCPCGRSMQR